MSTEKTLTELATSSCVRDRSRAAQMCRLPKPLIELLIADPDITVRRNIVTNQQIPKELISKLLFESDLFFRAAVAECQKLSKDDIAIALFDPSATVRCALVRGSIRQMDVHQIAALLDDPSDNVVRAVVYYLKDISVVEQLIDNYPLTAHRYVRESPSLLFTNFSSNVLEWITEHCSPEDIGKLVSYSAYNFNTRLAMKFISSRRASVREVVAPHIPRSCVKHLINDPDVNVRRVLALRKELFMKDRCALLYDSDRQVVLNILDSEGSVLIPEKTLEKVIKRSTDEAIIRAAQDQLSVWKGRRPWLFRRMMALTSADI